MQAVEQGTLQSWEAEGAGPKHNVLSTGLDTKGQKHKCHILWTFLKSYLYPFYDSEEYMQLRQHFLIGMLSSTLVAFGVSKTKDRKGAST